MTAIDQQVSTPPSEGPSFPFGLDYRWVAMGVVLLGSFMVVLDTTVVNLGLASIQRDFQIGNGVEWVVTAYLAAVGVSQATSGWLADRFGRKSMFVVAMVGFTAASLACAFAPTFWTLVGARVAQGLAGGLLMPIAMAMVYELFEPAERGRALGIFGIAIMVAPAIGPVLSGTLISSLSWRWLFLINVPVGVIGVPLALRLLRDAGDRDRNPLDRLGLALSTVGLAAFMIGISQGAGRGWTDPLVLVLLVVGVGSFIGFVLHAQRTDHPLVRIDILANPVFGIAMLTVSLMTVAQFTRLVYIPLELGLLRQVDEIKVGLVMLPSAVGMAATMPLGGRLVDRIGARIPVGLGAAILGLSFVGLAMVGLDTSLITISAILFVGGLGSGLAMMSPNIVAMNAVESRRVAQASALSNVTRQVAAAVGVAALSAVFVSMQPTGDPAAVGPADAIAPFHTVFTIAAAIMGLVVLTSQLLPGKDKALALQAERTAERNAMGAMGAADAAAPIEAV